MMVGIWDGSQSEHRSGEIHHQFMKPTKFDRLKTFLHACSFSLSLCTVLNVGDPAIVSLSRRTIDAILMVVQYVEKKRKHK